MDTYLNSVKKFGSVQKKFDIFLIRETKIDSSFSNQ